MPPDTAVDPGPATTLRAGDATADIYPEAGGRLGQFSFGVAGFLRGAEFAYEGWEAWGAYPLVPWSNRIPDGTFQFEGTQFSVPVNFQDGTAIHGLAAAVGWTVEEASDRTVELAVELDVDRYQVTGRQRFELSPTALDHTLSVTNRAPWRVPAGLGIHPWFATGPIMVPADHYWTDLVPGPDDAPVPVIDGVDLRTPVFALPMDRAYTGLTGTSADIGGVALSWTGPITHVIVYTEQEGWACVEPVTMANNGFRLADAGRDDTGVVGLDPDETLTVTYRYSMTPTDR